MDARQQSLQDARRSTGATQRKLWMELGFCPNWQDPPPLEAGPSSPPPWIEQKVAAKFTPEVLLLCYPCMPL